MDEIILEEVNPWADAKSTQGVLYYPIPEIAANAYRIKLPDGTETQLMINPDKGLDDALVSLLNPPPPEPPGETLEQKIEGLKLRIEALETK